MLERKQVNTEHDCYDKFDKTSSKSRTTNVVSSSLDDEKIVLKVYNTYSIISLEVLNDK